MLVGCVYVPMFGRTTLGTDVSKKVGGAQSRKPVRVGRSTRQEVLRALGAPYAESAEGRVLAYAWRAQNGFTIWPLCFTADSVDSWRTLVLRFNADHVLTSTEVLRHDEPLIDFLFTDRLQGVTQAEREWHWQRWKQPLPPELRPHRFPITRPATQPTH